MSKYHLVRQGECLSSLAKKFGFGDWRMIYDHPKNATFKKMRPNPNVIRPGDRIFIPDKETKYETGDTEKKHRFEVRSEKSLLRVKAADENNQPLSSKEYELVVWGLGYEKSYKGMTDDQGLIEEEIPVDAEEGKLTVWFSDVDPEFGYYWFLDIGSLDPEDEVTGVQARLINLGFDLEEVGGTMNPETEDAIKTFQAKAKLEATGALNEATRNKLREMHDDIDEG